MRARALTDFLRMLAGCKKADADRSAAEVERGLAVHAAMPAETLLYSLSTSASGQSLHRWAVQRWMGPTDELYSAGGSKQPP
jgi:hypothetical protein